MSSGGLTRFDTFASRRRNASSLAAIFIHRLHDHILATSGLINIHKAEICHCEEALSGFAFEDGKTLGVVR
jgi:hypothetical protein